MNGSWVGGLGGRIHGSALDGDCCLCASLDGDFGWDDSPSCFPSPLPTLSWISSRLGIFTVGTLGVCTGVTKIGVDWWVTVGAMGIMGVKPRVLLVGITLPKSRVSEGLGKAAGDEGLNLLP